MRSLKRRLLTTSSSSGESKFSTLRLSSDPCNPTARAVLKPNPRSSILKAIPTGKGFGLKTIGLPPAAGGIVADANENPGTKGDVANDDSTDADPLKLET